MASFVEMEGIYVNIESAAKVKSPTIETSPESSSRTFDRPVLVCLGLLNVILLAGIIGLGLHLHHTSAELSATKANLTSMTDQRDLLDVRLTNMSEELSQKKTCPEGWKMFQCSCYFFSTLKKTWEASRTDCTGKKADLVIISSSEEQKFLTNNIKGNTWIGLTDQKKEGTWKWTDGAQPTETYWLTGQPDGGGGNSKNGEQDCVYLSKSDKAKWRDVRCDADVLWACEK